MNQNFWFYLTSKALVRKLSEFAVGETGRNLEKRLKEHQYVVRKMDDKNGISVHAWKKSQSKLEWIEGFENGPQLLP